MSAHIKYRNISIATEGLGEEWQDWLRVEFRAEYRLLSINDAEDKIAKIKENKSKNKTAWLRQAVCLT